MRLTFDLLQNATQYINPGKDRQVTLRGYVTFRRHSYSRGNLLCLSVRKPCISQHRVLCLPNCAISRLHTFCSKVGELGRGPRSRPFATLIGASERARKVVQNELYSVSNGDDLTLIRSSPILQHFKLLRNTLKGL